MSLGTRIRSLRKAKKLTQKIIADRLGMGSSNFGHIENDRVVPSSKDLEKIADILDTTTDYLLGRSAKKEKGGTYSADPKIRFFEELEQELRLDLTDPSVQEMLKRVAKAIFVSEDKRDGQ